MMETLATNKHLKKVIEELKEYLENGEEVPLDFMFRFICELKVSSLIVPASGEGEYFTFENIVSEDDESTFLPLFTDIEEYNKHASDLNEFAPTQFDFDVYRELVLEDSLDGAIIDVEGDFIPLDYDFINGLEFEMDTLDDEPAEEYAADELKEIFDTVSNDSLVEFINSQDNRDIEKLYAELSDSVMLSLIIGGESLDELEEDGIIDVSDIGGLNLCAIEDGDICFSTLFTDKHAIEKMMAQHPELSCYGQIMIISELFEYVLRNDMDGVVINPESDDYIIGRDDILPQASGIEVIVENPKFKNSLDYLFVL